MVGITSFGGYVPRLRLERKACVDANGWFNSALRAYAKGERSMANWDEDTLTMAVAAARDCPGSDRPAELSSVFLASTTMPFADRQNSGVLATALNLDEELATVDVTGSQRCATTGLIQAMRALGSGDGKTLFVASEQRQTKAASPLELLTGDGAAALILGSEDVVAELVGSHQVAVDFVDHYRSARAAFDYSWEERWIRDEGYLQIVPRALKSLLERLEVPSSRIAHFILPSPFPKLAQRIAKMLAIPEAAVADNLDGIVGNTGAAHSLLLLVQVLEQARPDEYVLVAGFGQGCDALLFRTTERLAGFSPRLGIKKHLERRRLETNYNRFLAFRGLVEREKGIRAEADIRAPLSTLYRNRRMATALVGGRCRKCGTAQFPKGHVCVNPECGAAESQEDYCFAGRPAHIQSWTADRLTYSPDPPTYFGMVVFEEGGRLMSDFTDVDPSSIRVGMPVDMVFRIKHYDELRSFPKYFWKAAPQPAGDPDGQKKQ
jgi:3-hydroxy-3-methylglutaryl CoA synthase